MKKLTVFILSLMFALAVPVLSMADPMDKSMCSSSCDKHMMHGKGGGGEMMRHGFDGEGMARMFREPGFYLAQKDDLKLTDDQVASLKKIAFDLKKDLVSKGADAKLKRLELAEILSKPDYKQEDAAAKLKECADARLALATSMLSHSVQARDVLTAEQLKNVKDCRKHGCDGKSCGKGMKRHMADKAKQK